MISLDETLASVHHLQQLLPQLNLEIIARTKALSEKESEIANREKNVIEMESSIRERLNQEAAEKSNFDKLTAELNAAILENKLLKQKFDSTKEEAKNQEQRFSDLQIHYAEQKQQLAACEMKNEKLSKEKSALLGKIIQVQND